MLLNESLNDFFLFVSIKYDVIYAVKEVTSSPAANVFVLEYSGKITVF